MKIILLCSIKYCEQMKNEEKTERNFIKCNRQPFPIKDHIKNT